MGLTENERLEKLKELEELTKLLDEDTNTKLTEKNKNILVDTFRTNINLFVSDSKLRSMKRKDYKQLLVKVAKFSKFGQLAFERLFGKEKEEAVMKASEEEMKEMLSQNMEESQSDSEDISEEEERFSIIGKTLIKALENKGYEVDVLSLTDENLRGLYEYCSNYAYHINQKMNEESK